MPSLNCDKLVQYYCKKFFFEFNIFIILLLAIPSSVIYSSYTDYQDRSAWTPAAQMHTLSGSLPSKITIIHKYRYSNDYFKINDILFSCSTGTIQLCHTDFFKYGNQTAEILYTHDIDNRKIIYQIHLPKQTLLRYKDAQASILNQRQDSIKQGIMVFFVMFLPYLCLLLNAWRIAIYNKISAHRRS